MSETAKIRLVRCPKCENLLPEVTDYSVYQCGGCGAVLRAKNKGFDSGKSEKRRVGVNVEDVSEKYDKMVNAAVSDGSESDVRSSISSSSRVEKRILLERGKNGVSKSVIGRRDVESGGVSDQNTVDPRIGEGLGDMAVDQGNEVRVMAKTDVSWRVEDEVAEDVKGGPSNAWSRGGYSCPNLDESDNADSVEQGRVELLKKLDELKDQLSRSGNLIDKGKEKVVPSENWHPDAPLERMSRVLEQQDRYPDERFEGHLMYSYYPSQYAAPSHVDLSRSQIHRRGPYRAPAPAPYQFLQSHGYRSAPFMDDTAVYMNAMEPNPRRHHPSCSCYECHVKRQVATPVFPAVYSDVANDRVFNYQDNPRRPFGIGDYDQRLPLRLYNARSSHIRWSSDVEFGLANRRLPRVHGASGRKAFRSVAGGAPFLTCYSCFELLLLPKRALTRDNERKKMRCGACSTLIAFTVSSKKLVILNYLEVEDDPTEIEDALPIQNDARQTQTRATFSSDDYDHTAYDFDSVGRANRSTESNHPHSTSSCTSEAEEDWESLTAKRKDSDSAKNKGSSPPLGSSLQDHFEYSNKYHLRNRSREGSQSGRAEHEKALSNKSASRQMSGKESSATEIDLSSNEFGNTGTTFDSGEASREDRAKASRGAESFFAGIIKKSFKDKFIDDQEKASVTINGHLILNRLVKKAEKLAGPIHPGHYWYDFRAGFWGIIGGPCLGILPPFIEEFNYPMPENCAGGNTGVFVNGRELNHKDLTLLGSRGLPTEPDRSYIIEISGRVLDEDTGEELDCLGKLAPTVERLKRGFGMKAPKAAQ